MEINSFEDIESLITTEDECRKYLCIIRWGQWAKCPYCGNEKSYFIESGTRYKCANKQCYKKFSVTTMTLLSSTNLDYLKWIQAAILYIKKRGTLSSIDLEKEIKINARTSLIMKDKFDFVWKYVIRDNKSKIEIFIELFKKLFTLYEHHEQFLSNKYKNCTYHISNITDIKDQNSFDRLLHYVKLRMYFCSYIYLEFASPGEIMSEVFLYLHDNKIKDYDADFIIKIINRTISRMWGQYRKEHPNLLRDFLARQKDAKKRRIINISTLYLVDLIKSTKAGANMTRKEIRNNKELLDKYKMQLIEKRLKHNKLLDFNSHFD